MEKLRILEKLWRYKQKNREEYLTDRIVEHADIAEDVLKKEAAENAQEQAGT